MILSIIVAVGKNYEIGLNNELLWHLRDDLQYFKQTTLNQTILVGKNTYDSIGKPLPKRKTLIVCHDPSFKLESPLVEIFANPDDAVSWAENNGVEELFIIGGASIYKYFYEKADRLYLSCVDFEGEADTFFPVVDYSEWDEIKKVSFDAKEGVNDYAFDAVVLHRKRSE